MTQLPPVHVEGVAFWTAQLPDWQTARAVIRGESLPPQARIARPTPALLAPTERRRAPDTVAVALEVGMRACEAAGQDPAMLAAVFASTHGDLAISDYLCATLAATPALISPTRFHNSVHNAAAGYWSIGTKAHAPYTALSASVHTFGNGLLEAATQALSAGQPVLYVAFDTEARGALASMAPSRGLLGVAVVLGVETPAKPSRRLTLTVAPCDTPRPTSARSPAASLVAHNALAPCLPFFEALADPSPRALVLTLGEQLELQVGLE